jgi:hypothetical protein
MPQPVLADGLRSWLVGESPVPVLHAWGLPPELARDLRATAVGSIPALPPGELVATRCTDGDRCDGAESRIRPWPCGPRPAAV